MAAKGIVVYAVGVEPVLSMSYKFARDFMMAVAKITEGKFLPLGQVAILSDVIVAGAVEGMEMEALWNDLEAKVAAEAAAAGEQLSDGQRIGKVSDRLAQHTGQLQAVDVSSPYMSGYDDCNVDALVDSPGLREGKVRLRSTVNMSCADKSASYAWKSQESHCVSAPVSTAQHSRMVSKAMHSSSSK
jgi:hypothetical protein